MSRHVALMSTVLALFVTGLASASKRSALFNPFEQYWTVVGTVEGAEALTVSNQLLIPFRGHRQCDPVVCYPAGEGQICEGGGKASKNFSAPEFKQVSCDIDHCKNDEISCSVSARVYTKEPAVFPGTVPFVSRLDDISALKLEKIYSGGHFTPSDKGFQLDCSRRLPESIPVCQFRVGDLNQYYVAGYGRNTYDISVPDTRVGLYEVVSPTVTDLYRAFQAAETQHESYPAFKVKQVFDEQGLRLRCERDAAHVSDCEFRWKRASVMTFTLPTTIVHHSAQFGGQEASLLFGGDYSYFAPDGRTEFSCKKGEGCDLRILLK